MSNISTETIKVKEKYGLVESLFFPIASEPDKQHPVYGQPVDLGSAVKAYLSLTYAQSQAYGDDAEQLNVREFVSGTLDAETLLSDLEVDAVLFGSTWDGSSLTDNANDSPQPGGYAYIQKLRTRKGTIYRAVYLYYTIPNMNADNADTRGSSITFMNNSINCTVQVDKTGDWRTRADFATQAEAHAFIVGLANAVSGGAYVLKIEHVGAGDSSAGARFVNKGEAATVTFAQAPTVLYDNAADVTAKLSGKTYTISAMNADHTLVAIWPAT